MSDGLAIESVLVLRLSSVGDVVLTEPVVAALSDACPGIEIGYAVKARFRDLVASHPAISRLHVLEDEPRALRSLIEEVRSVAYSAVVDLHRNVRTTRIVRSSGIRLRTGYEKRELSDTVRVRFLRQSFRAGTLLVRRYLDALRPLGIDAPVRRPSLYLSEADSSAGAALLERLRVRREQFVAIVPGAVWPTKRWPPERFATLASGVVADLGSDVVLLGAPGERGLCEEVARAAGPGVTSAAGETTLGETAAVIAESALFIGNDSGPMHMAMALSTPTVALFGPTDPGQFDFEGHALVYRDLECSACSFYGGRRCRLRHHDCLQSIAPDEVLRAAAGLLGARGGPASDGEGPASDGGGSA